jgi:hypothetical protein
MQKPVCSKGVISRHDDGGKHTYFVRVYPIDEEKVWSVLWDDETYRKWANVLKENSSAKSDWKG